MESKGKSYLALFMGTFAMMVCFIVWLSLSPLVLAITKNAGIEISELQKTILLATPILLGSIARIPMGIVSDKFGGKKTYMALMIFLILPVFLISRVHSFGMLIFVALLLGMSGTSFAVGISYVTGFFPPEKQGLVLGIAGVGNIGSAIAVFTLPRMIKVMSLETIFNILIVLLLITTALFLFCPESKTDKTKTLKQALSVAKEKNTWLLSLFYFLTFGMFMSFTNLLPTMMPNLFATSLVTAGLWSAVFATLGTAARPIGGVISDKIRPMTLLFYDFILISVVCVILGIFVTKRPVFIACVILLSIIVGLGNGIVFKMVPFVAKGNTGAVTGFVGAMGGLGGYFPPMMLGLIKQTTGSYNLGIFLIVPLALICLYYLKKIYITGDEHIVK